ncbi:hypothetical protein H9L14_14685 [Sphingomonas sediminicola]|uniref:Uncharacterized protein n=1 Tax=Sphingomonas sediminicola TaxID=386874 RepID=A0ABX6T9Q2_9SPHN|nr:hypothetical protein [Sphingomonas sediminicola]QNP45735.1 hypothetical protein H9L14_14685 [Sphingomonas sediminicola]
MLLRFLLRLLGRLRLDALLADAARAGGADLVDPFALEAGFFSTASGAAAGLAATSNAINRDIGYSWD